MNKVSTSDRLKEIMKTNQLKQVDILSLCEKYCLQYDIKLAKNDLSQYISGKVQPGQDKLTILALALSVNEVWLMGYNVSSEPKALCYAQANSKLSEEEQSMLDNYRLLNEEGQERAITYIEDLVDTGKYKKSSEPQMDEKQA